MSSLPVAVDVMGGEKGTDIIIDGAVQAAKVHGISSILIGDEELIKAELEKYKKSEIKLITVRHASQVVEMGDVPSRAIRMKTDSSMRVAYELVREGEACGMVSTGNTGVMMALGIMVSGLLPGIVRPAIATIIPKVGNYTPTVMLDSGANVDCHAHQLVQFALMGDFYARSVFSSSRPRVALLANGSEKSKGNDTTRAAAAALSNLEQVNFVGYVEGHDFPKDKADVVVCDGFVGNVVLKTIEGSVEMVFGTLRHHVETSGIRGKLGLWLTKPLLKSIFKDQLNPSTYGAAPLLGLNDVAIVCHGTADQKAIMYAMNVASKLHIEDLTTRMYDALEILDSELSADYQEGIWNKVGQPFEKRKKIRGRKLKTEKTESVKKE